MPFDYESFMQGVITGLKLGRVPKGRTPPAPSGRYILTESGEKMLTEFLPPEEDVQLYSTGVWYYTIYHTLYGYQDRRRFRWSGDKELQLFAYRYNSEDKRRVMFLSESSLIGSKIYLDYEEETYNTTTGQWEIHTETTEYNVTSEDTAGVFRVWSAMFVFSGGTPYNWPDFEYKAFQGYAPYYTDVLPYVASFKAIPMITEGG